jgi:hypothetical protein
LVQRKKGLQIRRGEFNKLRLANLAIAKFEADGHA